MVLRLCKSLSILILHFVIKAKKKYYPQIILEECKYGPKRQKWRNLLMMILKKRLSDASENDSDKDSGDEFNDESNKKFVKS